MSIEYLGLTNFQSHRETDLELAPGINAILGASDSGKTSLLRAINWLSFNRPSGEEFRSTWGGETVVSVRLDSGETIIRMRNKENRYSIVQRAVEPKDFAGFGQDVPQSISDLLRLDWVNVQGQFDSHFMLSESPADVARRLNEVAGLDLIDLGLSKINGRLRRERDSISSFEQQALKLEEELEQLQYIDEMDKEVGALEQTASRAKQLLSHKQTLRDSILAIRQGQAEVEHAQRTLVMEPEVAALEEKAKLLGELKFRRSSLGSAIKEIEHEENEIERLQAALERSEQRFHELMLEQCPLCGSVL